MLKGTYSANPQAAALTRNADAYEIAVADVLVAKGVISITQAAITDTRLNNDLCGIVTGLIQQADTTEIFSQFTTFVSEFKQGNVAEFSAWTEKQKQEFIIWENGIRNILNENTAGNLLAMIGELRGLETTEKGNLVGALNEVFILGNEKKQKLAENLIAMRIEASVSDTWEQLLDKVLEMTDTSEDTVTAAALLTGYTAHNAMGEQIRGEIPERAGTTVDASAVTQDATYTYFDVPPGHYDAASKVRSANSNLELGYKLYATNVSLPWTPPAEITDYIIIPRYISCYNVGGVSGNNGSATSNVAVHGNGSLEYNNGSVQIAADDRFRMWCGAFNGDPSFSINFTKGDIYVKTI